MSYLLEIGVDYLLVETSSSSLNADGGVVRNNVHYKINIIYLEEFYIFSVKIELKYYLLIILNKYNWH